MPALLREADIDRWLDPGEHDPEALRDLLVPRDDDLEVVRVGRRVNKAGEEGPDLVEPVGR
jgi:putative SOS response-associated peptidase YedK